MSKLITKRIASAEAKLAAAHPGLRFTLTDKGEHIRVVARRGRTAVVDAELPRDMGVRALVADVGAMVGRATAPSAERRAEALAEALAEDAAGHEPLLADTPPPGEAAAPFFGEEHPEGVPDFAEQLNANADAIISAKMREGRKLVMSVEVSIQFVTPSDAVATIYGADKLPVAHLVGMARQAVHEQVGDFVEWEPAGAWREDLKGAVIVQLRRV